MRIRIAFLLACTAFAAVVVGSSGASTGIRYGIQDDAWLLQGPGELSDRLDQLERLSPDVVRFNMCCAKNPRSGRRASGGEIAVPGTAPSNRHGVGTES